MSLYKKLIVRGVAPVAALTLAYLIIPSEGVEYKPYYDTGGVLTVCYGHTGNDIVKDKIYTQEECEDLLDKDLKIVEDGLKKVVKVPLNDYQQAALNDFTFNVGIGNVRTSTLIKNLNAKNYKAACEQLSRWIYVKKKDCRVRSSNCAGIVVRRELERKYCMGEIKVPEHELQMGRYYEIK